MNRPNMASLPWRASTVARASGIALALCVSLVALAMLLTGAFGRTGPATASAFLAAPVATATDVPPTPSATASATASPSPSPTVTQEPTATTAPAQATQPQAPAPAATPAFAQPTNTPAARPSANTGCPTAGMGGFAVDLFNAINGQRNANGLWSLSLDGCAVYVAQLRSNDMASSGYFSHTSPSGQTAFSLLDAYGVPHGWAGENLARNNYPDSESVAVAIRDLMASQGHRDNILSGNYTSMGVAVAFDGAGMKYFTMVFIGPP